MGLDPMDVGLVGSDGMRASPDGFVLTQLACHLAHDGGRARSFCRFDVSSCCRCFDTSSSFKKLVLVQLYSTFTKTKCCSVDQQTGHGHMYWLLSYFQDVNQIATIAYYCPKTMVPEDGSRETKCSPTPRFYRALNGRNKCRVISI